MSKETMQIVYDPGQEVKLSELSERDIQLLRRVIEICREAKEAGNYPFGCLLADKEGNILMEQGELRKRAPGRLHRPRGNGTDAPGVPEVQQGRNVGADHVQLR